MEVPAETGLASAVLARAMVAQLTVIDAEDVLSARSVVASLVALARAVFSRVPQLVALVVAVTCTWISAVGARLWGPQARFTPPVMTQPVAVVPPASTLQLRPAGRVSVMV